VAQQRKALATFASQGVRIERLPQDAVVALRTAPEKVMSEHNRKSTAFEVLAK
jgi:hypothetical protein